MVEYEYCNPGAHHSYNTIASVSLDSHIEVGYTYTGPWGLAQYKELQREKVAREMRKIQAEFSAKQKTREAQRPLEHEEEPVLTVRKVLKDSNEPFHPRIKHSLDDHSVVEYL